MKLKIALIVLAVILMVQVLVYAYSVQDSTEAVQQETGSVMQEARSLESQQAQLEQEKKELEEMVASVPAEFLARFEDPETGFMEFLNYINDPLIKQSGVDVSMRRSPSFSTRPIAHHESRFSISFTFADSRKAEEILNFLLHQQKFPVKASSLNLRGGGAGEVSADLNMSLLIPARHAHPLDLIPREDQ